MVYYPVLPMAVAASASFIEAFLNNRRQRTRITNVDIEEIRKDIKEICSEKCCEYCGRSNKFKSNCEGCGAPCK